MTSRNMLLLSSSRSATTGFLEACEDELKDTLQGVKRALFIPYAVVGDEVVARLGMVDERFKELGIELDNVLEAFDPAEAIENAEAVLVSGGNTHVLLKSLYDNGVIDVLRRRVRNGMPYVGWSAGSNIAGKTICTTNDMPIVHAPGFRALGGVPFQLNPHFTDAMPPDLRGETREDRLREYLDVNRSEQVLGLPEGDALRVRDGSMCLCGPHDAWLFRYGEPRMRMAAGRDLSFLLDQ